MVFFTRWRSSSSVASVSSNLGASAPARRATPNLAASQAIWICFVKGSMSGARRAASSTLVSNFLAAAWASALSSQLSRLPSMRTNTGTLAECMEMVMLSPGRDAVKRGAMLLRSKGPCRAGTMRRESQRLTPHVNIIILDDYQDAVRKLKCASKLEPLNAKVFTNTVKGIGQLSVRLRDADVLVLIRERTQFPKQLLEKLPRLKLISQTGRIGAHVDVETCTRMGIAVAEGVGSPVAPAELTWALIMAAMRRLPQYIGNLKHGAWQQSRLKAASMPANFGLGMVLKGKTLGIWGYGKIGQLVAGYGRAFGMSVMVWGSESARARAVGDGYLAAPGCAEFF